MRSIHRPAFSNIDFAHLKQAIAEHTAFTPLLREAIQQANDSIKQRFLSEENISTLIRHRAELINWILTHVWHRYFGLNNKDIALVAVGGYGRGELHLYSDIDLIILLHHENPEEHKTNIEQFITLLWDLKLDIGHSVRSVENCISEATQDITVATNLMEAYLIAGPALLFRTMNKAVSPQKIWSGRKFFEAKRDEQTRRHLKYHDALQNLEPNVKEGPGGLRDIQVIGWVAKRHFGASTFHDLVIHRFLSESEYFTLMEAQEFLWKVRQGLHIFAERREDRLLFDHQKNIAKMFGYKDHEHRLAVEHFMKDYYVTITEISKLNEMLLQLFEEVILHRDKPITPTPINDRFQSHHNYIEAINQDVFTKTPSAILEIFVLLQQHAELQGVRASTIRLLRNSVTLIDQEFREKKENRDLFISIFRQPQGLVHQLRRMNRYGILAAYLPDFEKIVGLMQFDLFHVYTVDEHSIMVLRNIRRMMVAEFAHEQPFCNKICNKLTTPETLYLAGFLHDIAKGRGGNHSVAGAQIALDFCLYHGMNNYDARLVSWCVKNHLLMSSTAQRQDISDPDIITDFARLVGDQRHLDHLFLLTTADIQGTSPKLWNNWKASLLQELYRSTSRALRRGLEHYSDETERIQDVQAATLDILAESNTNTEAVQSLWKDFNNDYYLRHLPDEIAWHAHAIINNKEPPIVLIKEERSRGTTCIFIYAKDQAYLFASVTQALDEMRLDIVDARIITTKKGYVLDTFLVLDSDGHPLSEHPEIKQEILHRITQAVKQADEICFMSQRRISRRLKQFSHATQVTFSTNISQNQTIMEVTAIDQPGFLSRVAKALIECNLNLRNAKISTFGEKVEDIFYLTDQKNNAIHDKKLFIAVEQKLHELLNTRNHT
ncbi:[Protein-PII] uridylyltransferase / [Protein-PII]-UMP uridylyl-removing enzyme [hydrothermal vent metagenome]|uniref:[Protein-PII] uridylyltransferase / [Protein-PII]-UMP uridylyl-removing enzyme n=1 Tax=hydrothermal vent metagenome TaxID=652676 RepID=A0A3B0ZEW4_9ZZZZ